MRHIFQTYQHLLSRFPFATQSVQTGLLIAAGDVISQKFVEKREKLNLPRTTKYFAIGAFYVAPSLTVWYRILERFVGSRGKFSGLKKVALDQLIFAPFCLSGFILGVEALHGKPFEENLDNYKKIFPGLILDNYKLWPFVQAINFTLVPLDYQVLFVQSIAVMWNTYLCYKTKPEE